MHYSKRILIKKSILEKASRKEWERPGTDSNKLWEEPQGRVLERADTELCLPLVESLLTSCRAVCMDSFEPWSPSLVIVHLGMLVDMLTTL